ncbi:MAG: hypothetical protein AAF217_13780, partial [Pseudomonadota bacterium]
MFRIFCAILSISIVLVSAFSEPIEALERPIPECTSEKVLRKLVKRFNKTEKIYWENRGLQLVEVHNPHHHSTNPFPDSPWDRHY